MLQRSNHLTSLMVFLDVRIAIPIRVSTGRPMGTRLIVGAGPRHARRQPSSHHLLGSGGRVAIALHILRLRP